MINPTPRAIKEAVEFTQEIMKLINTSSTLAEKLVEGKNPLNLLYRMRTGLNLIISHYENIYGEEKRSDL